MESNKSNASGRRDAKAFKIIGDYVLTATILGKGQFGEVVLAKRQNPNQARRGSKVLGQPSNMESSEQEDQKQWLACKVIKKANLN